MAKIGDGAAMLRFIEDLYPICRSISGDGLRETLARVNEEIPVDITEVPTGTSVFDWTVPREWNIRGGFLETEAGERIVDFADHNLHVLNYSVPVDAMVTLDELDSHLFSLPEQPDLIPYRTSYYDENWGFCLRHRDRQNLESGRYRVFIDSSLTEGSLSLAETFIPGTSDDEILIYTHTCHPSLANDNLSGLAVTVWWAKHIANLRNRRYSYRFVWGPGTIGSITWLAHNQEHLHRIRHGLVAVLLGRPGPFHLKLSRSGARELESVAQSILAGTQSGLKTLEFDPYGYDERQFCSPGIDLPICRLSRVPNGEFPEYHTSADNVGLLSDVALEEALLACKAIGETLDDNRVFVNQAPMCEPQLGKRGLYNATGGSSPAERIRAMLWLLNQSDGSKSLFEIARDANLDFAVARDAARDLEVAGLLRESDESTEI